MDKTSPVQNAESLPTLLRFYNLSTIARELTARGFPTSRDRMSRMARGQAVPTVRELPAFAEILRVEISDLAQIISREAVA